MTSKSKKNFLIYQLGTNNWQREGEYAPGSGILHEAHHQAYTAMDGIVSVSIYPSEKQSPHEDPFVEVFKLSHPIPICESASPVSDYRWHSMSEEEFTNYRVRLENSVYKQMAEAEEKLGDNFDLAIAHHTFLNPLVLRNVLRKRAKEGKKAIPLACFVHGTALKMYVHEKEGKNQKEFPNRFLPLLEKERIFDPTSEHSVQICYAISNDQIIKLGEIFPSFPKDKTVISPNGINPLIFKKIENISLKSHLAKFDQFHYEGSPLTKTPRLKIPTKDIDNLVVIVSKFADWKRIDVLLEAMKILETKLPKLGLVIAGSGPLKAQKKLQTLAYSELDLKTTYFVGAQPQPILSELYTIADVGCFPSHNEPFGMVFVECMACGTPVIGANSGGPKDFVSSQVGALVDENEDKKELAKSLAKTIEKAIKENWKKTKSNACIKLVKEKYSVQVQCENLLTATKKIFSLNVKV